jgi:hypothetical protein
LRVVNNDFGSEGLKLRKGGIIGLKINNMIGNYVFSGWKTVTERINKRLIAPNKNSVGGSSL